MSVDLAAYSHPISDLFKNSQPIHLSEEQISFFNDHGYLSGLKILTEEQIDVLRSELYKLMLPDQAHNPLFYEFHLNESPDVRRTLFHALGAWRVSTAFHDLIFHPAIKSIGQQLLDGIVRL